VVGDEYPLDDIVLPRGALVRYREWYGASAPGVGLKLTAEEVAERIVERSCGETYAYSVLDPSAFAQSGGPSIAERMYNKGVAFRPGDNRRVRKEGATGGWDQLCSRIKGDGERPMLYVFSTCTDFIRTVPALQHDPDRAEDLDTSAEDHAADEARYACMSGPWIKNTLPIDGPGNPAGNLIVQEPRKWKFLQEMTFDELHEALKHERGRMVRI
jgi:hypothetical protein